MQHLMKGREGLGILGGATMGARCGMTTGFPEERVEQSGG